MRAEVWLCTDITSNDFVIALGALHGEVIASVFFPDSLHDEKLCRGSWWGATTLQHKGYTSLCSHMLSKHTDEATARHKAQQMRQRKAFSSTMYDGKTLAVHSWIESVVLGHQPFGFVKNDTPFQHYKHESFCRKNLMLYLHKLIRHV